MEWGGEVRVSDVKQRRRHIAREAHIASCARGVWTEADVVAAVGSDLNAAKIDTEQVTKTGRLSLVEFSQKEQKKKGKKKGKGASPQETKMSSGKKSAGKGTSCVTSRLGGQRHGGGEEGEEIGAQGGGLVILFVRSIFT